MEVSPVEGATSTGMAFIWGAVGWKYQERTSSSVYGSLYIGYLMILYRKCNGRLLPFAKVPGEVYWYFELSSLARCTSIQAMSYNIHVGDPIP